MLNAKEFKRLGVPNLIAVSKELFKAFPGARLRATLKAATDPFLNGGWQVNENDLESYCVDIQDTALTSMHLCVTIMIFLSSRHCIDKYVCLHLSLSLPCTIK